MSGKDAGRSAGTHSGYTSGFINGIQVACVLGAEIGYYEGFASVLLRNYRAGADSTKAKPRRIVFAEKVTQLCAEIDLTPENEHALEKLELLRKLAKQANIPPFDEEQSKEQTPRVNF